MKRILLLILVIGILLLSACGVPASAPAPAPASTPETISPEESEPEFQPDATRPAIQQLSVSDITEISAVISWLTNEPASSKVTYGLTTSSEDFDITDNRLSSTHSIGLRWLQPDTSYRYKVYSQDAQGNEAISNENVFRTEAIPLDRGTIIGTVLYADGTPASKTYMYIFKDEDSLCFAFGITDTDGFYTFNHLPFGRYEIYSSGIVLGMGFEDWWDIDKDTYTSFTRRPEVVNLTKNELRIAPTRTHFRNIIIYCLQEYLNTNQPVISWEPVPTAAYYKVEIYAGYQSERNHEDYEKEITVSDTSIIWPEQLIETDYVISVDAYDENGIYLTDGHDLFWIGHREGK